MFCKTCSRLYSRRLTLDLLCCVRGNTAYHSDILDKKIALLLKVRSVALTCAILCRGVWLRHDFESSGHRTRAARRELSLVEWSQIDHHSTFGPSRQP